MAFVAPVLAILAFSMVSLGAIQYHLVLSYELAALIFFRCVLIGAARVSREILK